MRLSQMSFDEELEKRVAHLESLPGYQLKEDFDALQRCSFVFNANANELAGHVAKFLNSQRFSRDVPESYVNELVRLLHNYLTSVTSLIDSQRVTMRHRWPTESAGKTQSCATCNRAFPRERSVSEFEDKAYAQQFAETFETGEAVFMTKLRNYATHYSIPLPNLGTTFRWEQGMPAVEQRNTLQLDRDKLLRWDSWTSPAKTFLQSQPEHFDLVPVIERYVNAANAFAAWFWNEIHARSGEIVSELNTKATELHLWQHAEVGPPDWVTNGDPGPPADWNGKLWRARKRQARYEHGSRGFRVWEVNLDGSVDLIVDDGWPPLPR